MGGTRSRRVQGWQGLCAVHQRTDEHACRTGVAWLRTISACTWPIRSYTSGTTSLRPSTACKLIWG